MKVLVTARGQQMSSEVDPRFGRAQHFILVDTETGDFEAKSNEQNIKAVQGAGVQAGRQALDLGAEAVITGHVGPKAFATLLAADIKIYINAKGTVSEAVEAFKQGSLQSANQPDVDGHW